MGWTRIAQGSCRIWTPELTLWAKGQGILPAQFTFPHPPNIIICDEAQGWEGPKAPLKLEVPPSCAPSKKVVKAESGSAQV